MRTSESLSAALLLVSSLLLSSFSWADGASIERGKQAAAMCSACHQADGNGMNIANEAWPRLAGLNAEYLAHQLHSFKDGTRKNTTMTPFANMLDDEKIRDVANYYASLPAKKSTSASTDAALLKRGKLIAQTGDWDHYIPPCSACHGENNQGNGTHFPALAGQHPDYIAQQIKAWQNGTRANDPQQLMASIAKRLSDADITAVSAWLATQTPNK